MHCAKSMITLLNFPLAYSMKLVENNCYKINFFSKCEILHLTNMFFPNSFGLIILKKSLEVNIFKNWWNIKYAGIFKKFPGMLALP